MDPSLLDLNGRLQPVDPIPEDANRQRDAAPPCNRGRVRERVRCTPVLNSPTVGDLLRNRAKLPLQPQTRVPSTQVDRGEHVLCQGGTGLGNIHRGWRVSTLNFNSSINQ